MRDIRKSLLLYAVTDRAWLPSAPTGLESLESQVEEAILGGATMIQLREKCLDEDSFIELALRVKAVTTARGVPLIVNDNLAVALAAGTDGLHIGQSDCDPSLARKSLPAGRLLGISVQTVRQASGTFRNLLTDSAYSFLSPAIQHAPIPSMEAHRHA